MVREYCACWKDGILFVLETFETTLNVGEVQPSIMPPFSFTKTIFGLKDLVDILFNLQVLMNITMYEDVWGLKEQLHLGLFYFTSSEVTV